MTFMDVIMASGLLSIIIWISLLLSLLISPILGIISIIYSAMKKDNQFPLILKILLIHLITIIFAGGIGIISHGIYANKLTTINSEGMEKSQQLALNISNSLYLGAFICIISFALLFFIVISIIILHFKASKKRGYNE